MMKDHLLLAVMWIAYCVLHSLLANESVKVFFQRRWENHFQYYRLAYNVFALVSLIGIVLFGLSIETFQLFSPSISISIVGGIISSAGIILMLVCIVKYFPGLSGLFRVHHKPVSNRLIISGVHRFVRHPLYLGTFIFLWGLVILFPLLNLLISTFIITVYTLIGIQLEEKKLVTEFGEEYKTYQETVPKIIPKLRAGENI